MDTYKYIEVKKSVFLKYKGQIVQLHSIITKQRDRAQYSSEFAFFHTHCTILYTVKAGIRSHNGWILPVESVHAAVNITNKKGIELLLLDFLLKPLIPTTFRETVIKN